MQLKSFFTLKGRRNRLSYFGWSLLVGLISSICWVALGWYTTPSNLILLAYPPIYLLSFWIQIRLIVQRCHDIGWNGWWSLLSFVPPVNLIFVLILLFKAGQAETNRYGEHRTKLEDVEAGSTESKDLSDDTISTESKDISGDTISTESKDISGDTTSTDESTTSTKDEPNTC